MVDIIPGWEIVWHEVGNRFFMVKEGVVCAEDRTFICSGCFQVICNMTKPLAYIYWGDVIQHFVGEDMVHWIDIYFKKTTRSETDGTSMLVCHEPEENSLV